MDTENTENNDIVLTQEQQKAYNQIMDNLSKKTSVTSIVGFPGVGKTTLISKVIQNLITKRKQVMATAPTHKAVGVLEQNIARKECECKTIHSFLALKLETNYDTGVQLFVPDTFTQDGSKKRVQILIVDESSMIGNTMFYYILETIKKKQCEHIIFLGDRYQLPVIDGNALSPVFEKIPSIELTTIVRQQKDNVIIKICSELRGYIDNPNTAPASLYDIFDKYKTPNIKKCKDRKELVEVFTSTDNWYNEDKRICCYTNKYVDAYNKLLRRKELSYNEEQLKANPYSQGTKLILQESVSKGTKVIFTNSEEIVIDSAFEKYDKNGIKYWRCYANGESTPINIIDEDDKSKFNDYLNYLATKAKNAPPTHKELKRVLWQEFYAYKKQYTEVKYHYSSTIHKLQGSTLKDIYVDLDEIDRYRSNDDFIYRLLYVAISRAKNNIYYC